MEQSPEIKVSVIVNAFNEETVIESVLESIRKSWFPGMETIISDDGSTDKTAGIVKKFKDKYNLDWLTLYSHENFKHARARNVGASLAKGEYLFFLDGDTLLPKGMTERTLEAMEKKGLDVASHYFVSDRPGIKYKILILISNITIWLSRDSIVGGGGGICIKKELFDAVGGFPHKELSEDLAFGRILVAHGAKIATFRERMPMNMRRLKENAWTTILIWGKAALYHLLNKDFKKGEVEYPNVRETPSE